jgi:hypothetical protein
MSYKSVVLGDSPAVLWTLNEASGATTAADSSGNRRNGTKHHASMGSGCVAYHAACIALLEGRARAAVLASLLQQGPFAVAQAGACSLCSVQRCGAAYVWRTLD